MFVIIDDDTTAVNLAHVSYVEKRDDRAAVIHFVQQSPPLAIVGAAAVRELFSKLAAVASPAGVIEHDNGETHHQSEAHGRGRAASGQVAIFG